MKANELVDLNLRHFWHPCTQMKDCETLPPLPVATASGSIITLKDGRRLIDGNSSWWCKSLGHGEPRVRKAFIDQLNQFEHVIMANCCTEPVAQLCEELSKLSPGLERVYLAENGSVSVEIAMKMSLIFSSIVVAFFFASAYSDTFASEYSLSSPQIRSIALSVENGFTR